jgi:hypothetical protein
MGPISKEFHDGLAGREYLRSSNGVAPEFSRWVKTKNRLHPRQLDLRQRCFRLHFLACALPKLNEFLRIGKLRNWQRLNRATAIWGVFALSSFFLLFLAVLPAPAQSTDVLTYHNDNARTGQNLNEEILAPANVNATHFGKLWILNMDGQVYAQPLYAAGINIALEGMHNVLFVATENDSVYAFDADRTNLFWHVSVLGTNEAPSDDRTCGSQISPEIGITATPVIDRQLGPNGTIFVVAMSKDNLGNYYQRLHALDLATGADRLPPATVAAKYPGTGDNTDGTNVVFDPAQYKERCGLLLLNGVVYTAWASHCDNTPYTGWIIGYDEHTLVQTNVLDITPNGSAGAIWMSDCGLAADAASNIYFLSGNGTFDTTLTANGFPNQGDYGNAFIKLSTASNQLAVADYFTMFDTLSESAADTDFGSGGALVLPDMTDAQGHTNELAVGAGKDGNLYLVDRSNLGKFNMSDYAIYQELDGVLPNGVWATPAYFNGTLYYGPNSYHLLAFPFQNAQLTSSSSQTAIEFTYPGTTPSISANGNSNGIVWAPEITSPAVLHAYAATNLAHEYYNSTQAAGSRDNFGSGNKFATPTIASARVYVGTTTGVGVFGLLDQSTLTPLETWRDNHFGNPSNVGAGANGASPAGDGVPNLIKYALGLNPATPATSAQLPSGGIQPAGGTNYLTLTVNRAARPSDITYIVETSSNLLGAWVSGPPNTVTLTNTATQLVVRDNTPVPAATTQFIRLRVTNP